MTDTDAVLTRREGAVGVMTFNRPERLNALNPGLTDALRSYFQGLEDRADIRVVVLRGAGRAYCAGLDLKDRTGAAPRDVQAGLAGQKAIRDIMIAMRECPQPIISIVEGAAAGGGGAGMCTPPMTLPSFCSSVGLTAGWGAGRMDGRAAAGATAGRSMASTRAPV